MQQTVEEIAALLHIHKEASAHGTALKNIADAAYNRLIQLNIEMEKDTWLDGTPLPKETAPPAPEAPVMTTMPEEKPVEEPAPYEEPPAEEPAPAPERKF